MCRENQLIFGRKFVGRFGIKGSKIWISKRIFVKVKK